MESTSPYRKLAPTATRDKNSSVSSESSKSIAASSRYTMENDADFDLDDTEEIPTNSSIVKRPSMYHSDMTAARTSRRQNLLNKRSQSLQQVDESDSARSSPAPRFVVTNPDVSYNTTSSSDQTPPKPEAATRSEEDLNKFVNLMHAKGSKFSQDEITHLKTLGRVPVIPGVSRNSALSAYSGVEEVAEVQQIMPDKSSYIPSLVEVQSNIHKRGPSSSNNSSKEDTTSKVHKRTKGHEEEGSDADMEQQSIKSVESIANLGPLPTMIPTPTGEDSRSPDLSQLTEIDPTIPPRSSRRPRSEILSATVSPSPPEARNTSQVQVSTPLKSEVPRSNSSQKRQSLPPPSCDAPLTPTQQKEKRISGVYSPPTGMIDYAKILKKNTAVDVKDRRRISSANRPLPAVPKDEDGDDEGDDDVQSSIPAVSDVAEQKKESPTIIPEDKEVNVQELMEQLKNDSSTVNLAKDQRSEELLENAQPQRDSIISDETVEKNPADTVASPSSHTFHVKSISMSGPEVIAAEIGTETNAVDNSPLASQDSLEKPSALAQTGSSNGSSSDRRIQFGQLPVQGSSARKGSKFNPKNYSVSTFNTDNASFHTAEDIGDYSGKIPEVIRTTDDMSNYDNDDYEDIEYTTGNEPQGHNNSASKSKYTKRHKKKSSSSSSGKKLRPFSISTLSKLLESTDGVIIGEEFDNLDISNDEKKYIEKIVDVVARLTADMINDPSRHDGTINRMKAALRILEGFE